MALGPVHCPELRAHQQNASCKIRAQEQQRMLWIYQLPLPASKRPACMKMHATRCKCSTHDKGHSSTTTGACSITSTSMACRHYGRQHISKTAAAASSNGSSMGEDSSEAGSKTGALRLLRKWSEDTRKLRGQLQSLGLAGVVAYGLFNTLYYTMAFLFVWFNISNVPAGLGVQAALRKAAEVFALVWAGSQVTKLARAGAALAFAPVVDRCLNWGVEKLKLKNKRQAFALVVVACLALAAAVLGGVVAVHA